MKADPAHFFLPPLTYIHAPRMMRINAKRAADAAVGPDIAKQPYTPEHVDGFTAAKMRISKPKSTTMTPPAFKIALTSALSPPTCIGATVD